MANPVHIAFASRKERNGRYRPGLQDRASKGNLSVGSNTPWKRGSRKSKEKSVLCTAETASPSPQRGRRLSPPPADDLPGQRVSPDNEASATAPSRPDPNHALSPTTDTSPRRGTCSPISPSFPQFCPYLIIPQSSPSPIQQQCPIAYSPLQCCFIPFLNAPEAVTQPFPVVSLQNTADGVRTVSDASGFHEEGPPGANLFVYHLPGSFDDERLCSLFRPFGTIVSTKVGV